MKRTVAVLLIFLALFLLCSCSIKPEDNEKKVEFDAQYIRTGAYAEINSYPILAVLRSQEELNAYYNANKNRFYLERRVIKEGYINETVGFLDAIDKYDEEFFKNEALVIIALEEVSGSITHEISNVWLNADGKFCVEIDSNIPYMCDDAMQHWHIIIEIPKEKAPKDYEDILVYKDNKLLNGDGHTHNPLDEGNGEVEPTEGYCGNTMTTIYFDNEKSYTFMAGNSVAMTDILRNLDYDKKKLCKCLPEYTVDTEFGTGYGINLNEGYVRCEKGQADLTRAQIDKLKTIIIWAQEKAE